MERSAEIIWNAFSARMGGAFRDAQGTAAYEHCMAVARSLSPEKPAEAVCGTPAAIVGMDTIAIPVHYYGCPLNPVNGGKGTCTCGPNRPPDIHVSASAPSPPARERSMADTCPYAKSDMTPCFLKDGDMTIVHIRTREVCVGCERSVKWLQAEHGDQPSTGGGNG